MVQPTVGVRGRKRAPHPAVFFCLPLSRREAPGSNIVTSNRENRSLAGTGSEAALELLEFLRVREWLASFATSERARGKARALIPAGDVATVREGLRALAEAKPLPETLGDWPSPPESDAASLLDAARRGRRLEGRDLAEIAALVLAIERSARYWKLARESAPTAARPATRLHPAPELGRGLERAVDREGGILDSATPELARIRGRLRETRQRVIEKLERIVQRGGAAESDGDEGYITQRQGRYVLPVRADRFDRSRGVVHDVSRSGAVLFVEPFGVLALNNEVRELESAESEEIARILDRLTALVAERADDLEEGIEALAELDLLWARVRLSAVLRGSTPEIDDSDGARLALSGARHPLLWKQAGGDTDPERAARQVIPFDLTLSGERRVLLVSGPNMGGKTIFLKAVGLAAAMAHCGLDVCAAEGARLPFVRRWHVDIGDAQSLDDHLSSFAGRLVRMDEMARESDTSSLCLLDEIGAGTDPDEGAALARALLEHLATRGAWTVATTHLGGLKTLAAERREVVNASMEIDSGRLVPLYQLQVGIPGASYALATARRLGLAPAVLERAESLVSREARALEELLAELAEERRLARGEREALERERRAEEDRRSERAREENESEGVRRERERRRLDELTALGAQARALLREVRREAERAAGERDAERLSLLARGVRDLERGEEAFRHSGEEPASDEELREVVPGMEVRHAGLGIVARVVEGPDEDGNVVLARGSWRITGRVSDLRAAGSGDATGAGEAARATRPLPIVLHGDSESASWEVDVRGMTSDEALVEVDRALDRALLAGHHELRVIHGVGKGVLRQAISRHLVDHPQVAGQRLGLHGEGGRGVTVAVLG